MTSERVNMAELVHPILLVSLPTPENRSRSISPHSPSSTRKLRGIRLFRAIGRRLSRMRNDEDDSTDSEPSSPSEAQSDSGSGNNSPDSMRSKEANDSALRKLLNTLNLTTSSDRRSSNSDSDISSSSRRKSSTTSTPKKILRQPVSYTYVRGLSGLPTIRVPRSSACCSQNCGRCHTPSCGR